MDVRMDGEIAAPGVESRNDAGSGTEVLGIGEELGESVFDGAEEDVGKDADIGKPECVELGREGEDDVEMAGVENALALGIEPVVDAGRGALRACAVLAGIGSGGEIVAVGAVQDVFTEGPGAALRDQRGCATHMGWQRMGRGERGKVVLENALNCGTRHEADAFSAFLNALSPIQPVQRAR